ncbi:glycosyltransferase family 9 protein [Candidatus Peregrinibacteria bacterium]|nr:glycosyltransferase family 9 protein [Candidatus Peregrinibacteria bacterium]MBI3816697.1 glycosyltransferase family 9 protein [Candidatus Peregrinibacteria bacterium]
MNTILWTILTALCSPFLFLEAMLRKRPERRNILIIQWAKLGDMVCTTPMFRAIRQAHPDWTVHLLCREQCLPVVSNNPFLDHVITHRGKRSALVRRLRRERYDVVINCLPVAFWSMLGLWCGAPDRINTFSCRHGHIVRWARLFNAVNVPFELRTRTFDHYLSLLSPLGIPAIPYALDFFPSSDDETKTALWMNEHHLVDRSFACFNVSAGNVIKEWPAEKFTQLANFAIDHLNLTVVLSTLDRERIERIRKLSAHPEKIIDGSSLTLGQMGALCKSTAAFVAVDTGPLFIAYAAGAPVVVIVGGSDPSQQIPPEGERVIHVLPPQGCEPWMFVAASPRGASVEQLRCIRETSVEAVARALKELCA